jgi:Zn-dependent protease
MGASWWLASYWEAFGPAFVVSWVLWIILSITLHELAHGWVAIRCGDDVPIHTGHMTWNPFVHIPFPWAWVMFAAVGITWGLMPTNPQNYTRRHDESRVAFAGPAMNLFLACAGCVALVLWDRFAGGVSEPMRGNVRDFITVGMALNLALFVFNLVPVPPLDGSRILADFVPAYRRLMYSEAGAVMMMVGIVVMFSIGSGVIWGFVFRASGVMVRAVSGVIGGGAAVP